MKMIERKAYTAAFGEMWFGESGRHPVALACWYVLLQNEPSSFTDAAAAADDDTQQIR